jgi:uncharacterized membrane protein YtjA (UPF0391 family)
MLLTLLLLVLAGVWGLLGFAAMGSPIAVMFQLLFFISVVLAVASLIVNLARRGGDGKPVAAGSV